MDSDFKGTDQEHRYKVEAAVKVDEFFKKKFRFAKKEIFILLPLPEGEDLDVHFANPEILVFNGDDHYVDIEALVLMDFVRDGYEAYIMAHYHPKSSCQPSKADDFVTCYLSWITNMVGGSLVDHWIYGNDGSIYKYLRHKPRHLPPDLEFIAKEDE
jgi:DNA repair protein RadC